MFILKFLFFAFVCFLVYMVWMAFQLVWNFRRTLRHFQSQQADFRSQQADFRSQQTGQPRGAHASRQNDGSVVIDHRQPKAKKQQIIADDEGEYIDFEEN